MQKHVVVALCLGALLLLVSAVPVWAQQEIVGAVYTMTNDPQGNAVLVFNRAADGSLTAGGSFATGGLGTGGREPDFGLANAGALALSHDRRLLFVVNPDSDDLSVFAVLKEGLQLLDRVSSGGQQPISVTVHRHLVYVLNAGGNVGGSDNISGFVVRRDRLSPLSDSTRPLSAAVTSPAQIRFSPDGKVLVVTEKATNVIDTYTVGQDGRPTGPHVTQADAQTPFGFEFNRRNQLFISDDFNDAPDSGALSSYLVADDGSLRLVSSVVLAEPPVTGACWVVVSPNGHFVYVANTVSSTISLYRINTQDGSVTFVRSFPSVTGPTDLDFSRNGRFLYVLVPNQFDPVEQAKPGINVFRANPRDGSLMPLPGVSGLPLSVDGLVVR
jgi:6-phosphogluconolactonase (cycloisomerase 2 family)